MVFLVGRQCLKCKSFRHDTKDWAMRRNRCNSCKYGCDGPGVHLSIHQRNRSLGEAFNEREPRTTICEVLEIHPDQVRSLQLFQQSVNARQTTGSPPNAHHRHGGSQHSEPRAAVQGARRHEYRSRAVRSITRRKRDALGTSGALQPLA